jgi:hypothetical protein
MTIKRERNERLIMAVLAAASIMLVIAAAPASAATRHVRITWGIDQGYWDQFRAQVTYAHGVRVYYDKTDDIPVSWPMFPQSPWGTLSLRPSRGALLSGRLDRAIRRLVRSAPPHSQLTIDHENIDGGGKANPLRYPPSIHNAVSFVRMQRHMERLCKGTNVRFGVLAIGPVSGPAEKWIYGGDDWFGYDIYDNKLYWNRDGTLNERKLWGRLSGDLAAFRRISGRRHPFITIGETNSPRDAHRANWFGYIARWFDTHNGETPARILTYWTPGGRLSGAWPPSRPVVRRLRYLSALYRGI